MYYLFTVAINMCISCSFSNICWWTTGSLQLLDSECMWQWWQFVDWCNVCSMTKKQTKNFDGILWRTWIR